MTSTADLDAIVSAAQELPLEPRGDRWCHLSLCVLDAVFSINSNYATTTRTVRAYASRAGLEPVLAPAAAVAGGEHTATEQPLSAFVAAEGSLNPDDLADALNNRQLTSTRSGIRKADAAQRYARLLVEHGVEVLSDMSGLLSDLERTDSVERALAAVPGHGSGVRVAYLWMLAGDDQHVKADRMLTRWVSRVVSRPVNIAEAANLVTRAAEPTGVTPWVLDHAIWQTERARS